MSPRPADPLSRARAAAIALALAGLAALPFAPGVRAPAAGVGPAVQNPHGRLREDCALCHTASGWKPARPSRRFDHAKYGFALTGAHAATPCVTCHGSLDFTRRQKLCVSCHEDPHRGELGTACERCHDARSFIDRAPMLRAHELTHFPLTGAHAALDCESCHPPGGEGKLRYVGTRADCQGCHLADYQAAKQPDHTAGGFPLDCEECHTPITWTSARFDHAKTAFPLTGAHRTTPCQSCHGDGVYKGKSTECYSCHKADYDATTNPIHSAAPFPTTCATCHNTTSWAGATFDHDGPYFPIYSGTHAGRWSACTDCHPVTTNFATFNCLSCHPHDDKTQTDSNHSGVPGYVYDSAHCYSCHPRGTT